MCNIKSSVYKHGHIECSIKTYLNWDRFLSLVAHNNSNFFFSAVVRTKINIKFNGQGIFTNKNSFKHCLYLAFMLLVSFLWMHFNLLFNKKLWKYFYLLFNKTKTMKVKAHQNLIELLDNNYPTRQNCRALWPELILLMVRQMLLTVSRFPSTRCHGNPCLQI